MRGKEPTSERDDDPNFFFFLFLEVLFSERVTGHCTMYLVDIIPTLVPTTVATKYGTAGVPSDCRYGGPFDGP